jgi:biotin carboxyl carrier protein
MELRYLWQGQPVVVQVEPAGDGYQVTVNGQSHLVRPVLSSARPGEIVFEWQGQRHRAYAAADGPARWVWLEGETHVLEAAASGRKSAAARASGHDTLEARMPGVVRQVAVQPGQRVERGQVLVVLEAMKMEIRVTAPHAGLVQQVAVTKGQAVERGQSLVEIEADPP